MNLSKQNSARFLNVLSVFLRFRLDQLLKSIFGFKRKDTFTFSRFFWISSCSLSCACATCDFGVGIGYRRDQIGFDTALYKERNRDLSGIPLEAHLQWNNYLVLFGLRGDFGWYVSGQTSESFLIGVPNLSSYQVFFKENAGGFFSDGEVLLGARFSCTKQLQCAVETTFGAFYETLKREESRPETNLIPNAASITYDLTQTRLQRLWWGPSLGVHLAYQPQVAWIFTADYFYYFLYLNQSFEPFSYMTYFGSNSAAFLIRTKSHASLPGHGQLFRGKIAAQMAQQYWLNLRFDWFYFVTDNHKTRLFQSFQELFPIPGSFLQKSDPWMRAWWHSFSLLMEIEYSF